VVKPRLTGLGVILRAAAQQDRTAAMPKADVDLDAESKRAVKLWIKPSINPNRQRKDRSGEIARKSYR
jgi:hypothetical protein